MAPRCLTLLALWLSVGCACNRTEEPAAPVAAATMTGGNSAQAGASNGGGAGATPSAGGAPAGSAGSAAATACVVPFAAAPVAAKAESCPSDPASNLTLPRGRVTFVDAPSRPSAEVELARTDAARERGLMYRTDMPQGAGMLFSWPDQRVRTFWMRNTCIPLDMLYITSEGIITGILEQVPTLNEAPRSIGCPVAHVLELNAGWARAHGIEPGMKVEIEG
jgi:uncharacterized protein